VVLRSFAPTRPTSETSDSLALAAIFGASISRAAGCGLARRCAREVIERYAAGRSRGLESGTHGDLCSVQVVGPSGLYAEDVLRVGTHAAWSGFNAYSFDAYPEA
jgi:hypothetical protein